MQIKRIELNPVEATSYWWIIEIKKKLQELLIITSGKEEAEFLSIFYNFTDIEWRKLYLDLIEYIGKKVENILLKEEYGYYYQDTKENFHKDINEVLCHFVNKSIPDISLTLLGVEESSICTNKYGADRIYNVSGIVPLDTLYESNYILSGDTKYLSKEKNIR